MYLQITKEEPLPSHKYPVQNARNTVPVMSLENETSQVGYEWFIYTFQSAEEDVVDNSSSWPKEQKLQVLIFEVKS